MFKKSSLFIHFQTPMPVFIHKMVSRRKKGERKGGREGEKEGWEGERGGRERACWEWEEGSASEAHTGQRIGFAP